ncbi:fibroblast growth factor 1-like [Dendronephthya gigantea]|uniref:fibroblast growth factor 1-like n=1 Tax=Dendronephthya gigantea TaxID=151771 RepID=UPI00106BF488|nr:fibroblast growth factor 1-like [Dendronephthya gigantea]XP_028401509.1 fibroblast growth factor 1-like [Dendronephthya gigantea]
MAYSISYYYDPDDFEIKIEEVDTLSEKAEIQKNIRFSTISAQLLPDPDWCKSFMGKRSSRRRRLICRNGYYLAVHPNGTVKGTRCKSDPYTTLEIISVGAGLVKMLGVEAELFVTIDDSGVVRATDVDSEECVFEEAVIENFFSIYRSCRYSSERWLVSLDTKGNALTSWLGNSPCLESRSHFLAQIVSSA